MDGSTSPHSQRSAVSIPRVHAAVRQDPNIYYTTTAVSFLRILQHTQQARSSRALRHALDFHVSNKTKMRIDLQAVRSD